jgi:hypothetical protein
MLFRSIHDVVIVRFVGDENVLLQLELSRRIQGPSHNARPSAPMLKWAPEKIAAASAAKTPLRAVGRCEPYKRFVFFECYAVGVGARSGDEVTACPPALGAVAGDDIA